MESETDNPSRKYSRLMALFVCHNISRHFILIIISFFFHFLWKLKTVGTVTILKMMTTPFNWIGKFSDIQHVIENQKTKTLWVKKLRFYT